MAYLRFAPAPALQPYVVYYYIWEHTQPIDPSLIVNSAPKGLGGMVINYSDPYYVTNKKGDWDKAPDCFLAGQFTKSYSLCLQGKIGMLGAVFFPAAISHLFQIPMVELTNYRIDLSLILGNEISSLREQIQEENTHNQRIEVLDYFLLRKLYNANPKMDLVDYAIWQIMEHKGLLSIESLSNEVCISNRHFRRLFTEKIGVTPKLYARIKRFNHITLLTEISSTTWADMVYKGGYYDQSHFIRDFCDFSGKKPSEYVNYNRHLAELLEA